MNKQLRNILLYTFYGIFLMLLCLLPVHAITTNQLQQYYSMETFDGNITDSFTNTKIATTTPQYYNLATGIISNGLYADNHVAKTGFTTSTFNYNGQFSVNYWTDNFQGDQNIYNQIRIGDTSSFFFIGYSGGTLSLLYGNSTFGHYSLASSNVVLTGMNMYTLTYQNSTKNIKLYVDGGLTFDIINSGTFTNNPYIKIGTSNNGTIDEVSVFSNVLSPNTILNLFNNGNGLNYNQTNNILLLANITYYNTNFTVGHAIFSSIQCINNNGQDYICNDTYYDPNDNSFYCNADNIQPCGLNKYCLTYVFDQNNSQLNAYGTSTDCHTIGVTNPNVVFICSNFFAKTILSSIFGVLYGHSCDIANRAFQLPSTVCDDNAIQTLIAQNPNDVFYTEGQCTTNPDCLDDCTPNTYDCSNNIVRYCTLVNNGCYGWNYSQSCVTPFACSQGSCIILAANETGNNVGFEFNNLSINTRYGIMIVVSILVLLLFTIVTAMFGEALSGLLVGLVVSMIVSLTLSIVFRLSLLIPVLYIIFGGMVVAMLMRRIFVM